VIDGDADGHGLLARDAGLLELVQGEAAAQAHLEVVALGRGVHDGSQQT